MNHILNSMLLAGAFVGLGCQGDLPPVPPLATGQRNVTALTADGDHVYWSTADGFVRRVPSSGGAVETVAEGLVAPGHLALDASAVYWSANGTIGRVAKAGGAVEVLFPNEDGVGDLKVDDTNLYWLRTPGEVSSGQVRKAPKIAGAAVEALTSDSLDPGSLALSGASLYFPVPLATAGAPAGVRELPTGGGAASTDVSGVFHTVVTSGANLCTAGADAEALITDPNATAQAITCSALDGSNTNVLVSGLTNVVTAITLDDTNVYFGTADGQLSVIALDGTAPIVMPGTTSPDVTTTSATASAGPVLFAAGPTGGASIALDATSVYWAHTNGDAIFVLPRF